MIMDYEGIMPAIHKKTFIAENATVIGDVTLGEESSVWFNAVIRGDDDDIKIGSRTSIQDNVVVHSGAGYPVRIGSNVTVGHSAIVHGCTVEDNVVVGMGAVIMNGAHIGSGSIIGGGALVLQNAEIPENSVVVGNPAKVIKPTSDKQREYISWNADEYVKLAGKYAKWDK